MRYFPQTLMSTEVLAKDTLERTQLGYCFQALNLLLYLQIPSSIKKKKIVSFLVNDFILDFCYSVRNSLCAGK